MVDWKTISGKWTQFVGSARETWGELSDDDLEKVRGNREKLIGSVQERYGITRDEAAQQVDSWMNENDSL